jgi:cell division protein FtsW (lipid II flippase)
MSYGGTSLVTTMAALGILANVHLQRHISLYR